MAFMRKDTAGKIGVDEAVAALRIEELTQSVTALLANMPGLSFSKDVKSGKYLACNQAFAE
jgi:ethanolamine utilization microcompartment shell protein EutS